MKGNLLPVKRMVLYKHGVGYVERQGKVKDTKEIKLSFKKPYMNDLLKSLLVFSTGKGLVTGVSYETPEDVSKLIEEKAIRVPEREAMVGLFRQLKGYTVEIQTNTEILTLSVGAAVTRETLAGAEPSQESIEALLGLEFQSFRFDHPERDVGVTLAVYPGLSDFGRVRAELNAKVRWEIARDFFLSLTLLESYDSEPPTEEASKNDLTLTTSLGWSF